MTTLELCQSTLEDMIRRKWLPTYKRTGKYRAPGRDRGGVPKELGKLLWYAQLDGPLYQDARLWRAAYRAIDSFRQNRSEALKSQMIEAEIFGPLDAPLQDVQRFLMTALSELDFKCVADAATQSVAFSSQHSCSVEDLPEPFGKWAQIKRNAPMWDQQAQLSLRATCKLAAQGPRSCVMTLTTSTFAPGLHERLAVRIANFTGQTLHPPDTPLALADPRLAWLTNGPLPASGAAAVKAET